MKKINIVKKNEDFSRIIKNFKPYKTKSFIIFVENNTDSVYKFGISIGKKVGNAVTRNKLKRQVKTIIDKNIYKNNFNCIIIIKKEVLNKTYHDISIELNKAFEDIKVIKEEKNE